MKLWSLQAVRFFAALAVVHFHAAHIAFVVTGQHGVSGARLAEFGRAGVDVFFVLSGVVISLAARRSTAEAFAWSRVRRIFPPYLVAAAPFVLLAATKAGFGWRDGLASLALWPMTDVLTSPALPVGWTLCFEVLFYAAVTVVVWRPVMAWVLLAGYAAALALGLGFIGSPMILEFLAGVGLSFAPRWRPAAWAIPLGVAALVATSLGGVVPPISETGLLGGEHAWLRVAGMGLPAVLIVWGAMQISIRPNWLTYMGDASYALYLIHPLVSFVMVAVMALVPLEASADAWVVAGIGLSLLAGWQLHERVEKPLLSYFGRKPALAAA